MTLASPRRRREVIDALRRGIARATGGGASAPSPRTPRWSPMSSAAPRSSGAGRRSNTVWTDPVSAGRQPVHQDVQQMSFTTASLLTGR